MFGHRWVLAMAIPSIVLATGCKSVETPFPQGLEPLEENRAELPAPEGSEPRPERLEAVSGETDDFWWTHARGYVHADISQTWQALQEIPVNVDRREVDEWTWDLIEPPAYDHEYVIHNTVFDIITVQFDVTWRHGLVVGTSDVPEVVGIRFQKTFGSDVIELLEGSIVLLAAQEDTEIQLIEHVHAFSGSPQTTESYLRDLFQDAVDQVHGRPLQTF